MRREASLLALVVLSSSGCSANGGAAPREPPAPRSATCTEEALDAFDPKTPVRSREALPPMQQRLGEQTVYTANVPCEPKETDEECEERARGKVAKAYPPPAKLSSELVRELSGWRVTLDVDGASRTMTFVSADRLRGHVAALKNAGRAVHVRRIVPFALPDSPRSVNVGATTPAAEARQVALRYRLTLEPPGNEVAAMLRLREEAAKAALAIQYFAAEPDGALVVELICRVSAGSQP